MAPTTQLDAVAAALHSHGIGHEQRGLQLRFDCPVCGTTGRRGRRAVVATNRYGYAVAIANCGCQLVDIARALDLAPSALLKYRKVHLSSTRNAGGNTDAAEEESAHPAYANAWGVTRTARKLRRGNLRAVERVAEDLDRRSTRLAPGDWLSYDSRRAARELGMDRKSIRLALRWLIKHGILTGRQPPAPGDKVEVVTQSGGKREVAKSACKQYRPLTEKEQIRRLSRRATPGEWEAERARQTARFEERIRLLSPRRCDPA
jgi:hypothetical protein